MFYDAVELKSEPKLTADGYLVAIAKVARTGIQLYTGDEMGRPDMQMVRVYRPENEVFDSASLHSFAYRPMTNDHPSEAVTSKSWRDVAIGQAGGEVLRDGDHIKVPLIMMDAAAIGDYNDGKRELSVGYTADVKWESGKTPDGEEYDAIQTNIRANHIALVQAGRAGTARIGDTGGHNRSQTKKEAVMAKVKYGKITIDTDEQAAEAIEALKEQAETAQVELQKTIEATEQAVSESDKILAEKDAEIEALKAELAELKGQEVTGDALNKLVADRAALIAEASKIADVEYTGDENSIRRQAVVAAVGAHVKDESDAYIKARYDILKEGNKSTHQDGSTVSDFQTAYEQKLTSKWRK